MAVNSLKLPSMNAGLGEAHTALLVVRLAASTRCSLLLLEGDSLVTVLAIIGPSLFPDWNTALVIADIHLHLFTFSEWKTLKITRCANSGAHKVVRWATANYVFGNIPTCSSFIFVVRLRSGKDPLV